MSRAARAGPVARRPPAGPPSGRSDDRPPDGERPTLVAPAPARSPWQRLYAAALARRRRRGGGERLDAVVVSIGNLHWGGGGKTPFAISLARHLADRAIPTAILSRGYGRRTTGALVVSRGAGPEVDVEAAGDEPWEMARALTGVGVVVGERRVEAGRLALAELRPRPRVLLLDDGFSHVALARDLELLLFPRDDPFGGARLAPSGRLREPLAAAAAADAVLLTGCARGESGLGEALARALGEHGYRGPGFAVATLHGLAETAPRQPFAAGARVVAVAGTARPVGFFHSARQAGFEVASTLPFPDHARYGQRSLARIVAEVRRVGAAAVLTTAKDAAKLTGKIEVPLAVLPITAAPEPAFWRFFDAAIDRRLEVGSRAAR